MSGDQNLTMDTSGRIENWLGNIDPVDSLHHDDQLSAKPKTHSGDCGPVTPHKRMSLHDAVDEPSPTNTAFTGNTIFDSPLAGKGASGRHGIANGTFDDASDITSIDGGDACPEVEAQFCKATKEDQETSDAQGLADGTLPNLIPGPKIRRVRLTSCLQCTLANLPCSCLPPTCTRCTRNGNSDTCLLQRYKLLEEIKPPSQASDFRVPILLRCATDDAESYNKKVELAEHLMEKWRCDQDKRNWVLPNLNSPHGTRAVAGTAFRPLHPGENLIHMVWAELNVETT